LKAPTAREKVINLANIRCTTCNERYPEEGLPFKCPSCGGIYDYDGPPEFNPEKIDKSLPGMWEYRHSFDLKPDAPVITLGEGKTPFIWDEVGGREVGFKLEYLNPTGSYKDRGSCVLASHLVSRGAKRAIEDSSGNAGASFAAYSARAGLPARVFVPESASGPKRVQIEMYGADLVRVPGPRSNAAAAALKEAAEGAVYASHAYLPFGLTGIATIAYELWDELGEAPGTVIAPVGHGGLLLGIVRGFSALKRKGLISSSPYFVGVQAKACAPVWTEWKYGAEAVKNIEEGHTFAEGVRVRTPVRASALIKEIGRGEFFAVEEDAIMPAYKELARRAIYVEPTSALVWNALESMKDLPEPVVLIMSGSGFKFQS
jgi:threonine synthase